MLVQQYFPLLLHVLVAIGFATAALVTNVLVGRSARRNSAKDTPYECGIEPERATSPRFSVKFYLVAMLFIIFDIEIVFMYPWAVTFVNFLQGFRESFDSTIILWSMLSFVLMLLFAFVYAVKKGALDWNRPQANGSVD